MICASGLKGTDEASVRTHKREPLVQVIGCTFRVRTNTSQYVAYGNCPPATICGALDLSVSRQKSKVSCGSCVKSEA
jgi:hypothetical protein